MAQVVKIKRSAVTTIPVSLAEGELAYSEKAGVKLLYIGTNGGANIETIGGSAIVDKVNGIEAGADVTDATNVNAAGAVMESDYGANQILAATSVGTPVGLTIGEQTLVGRITAGNIAALTPTQVRTMLNVADGANAYVHPNHTGDVTSTGDGATVIANNAVTLAKMATIATDSFLGRDTAGTGNVEVLSVATVKTLLGLAGTNSGDQTITLTGDVTGSGTGSFAATIASGAVTLAKMANLAQNTFIGRITASTGVPEALTAANVKTILSYAASEITNTPAGNIAASTVQNAINELDTEKLGLAGGTMTGNLTLAGDPANALHAATKQYVDARAAGLDPKESVDLATTGSNITLSGEQTIDGTLTSSSRVLVKDQIDPAENGIYVSAAGAWSRASDFDSVTKITKGSYALVAGGSTNSGKIYFVVATPDTLDIDDIDFAILSAAPAGGLLASDFNAYTILAADVDDTPFALTVGASTFVGRKATGGISAMSVSEAKTLLDLSGTNTGDQTITLTGDVTGTGTGSFAATIATNAVTLAKMAQIATDSFLGRDTAGTGNVEVLSVATVKTLLGLSGTNSGDQTITLTGDVTGSGTGSFAATIANSAVTLAKMANLAQNTIIGRITASTGVPEALTAANIRTIINVENGATADQTDSEIETAYNNQVAVVSQAVAEAASSTTVYRWTPQRVGQAIAAATIDGGTF